MWPLKLNRLEDEVEVSLAICGGVSVYDLEVVPGELIQVNDGICMSVQKCTGRRKRRRRRDEGTCMR